MRVKASSRRLKNNRGRQFITVPNLFTTLNLFCGFLAVAMVLSGKFTNAAWLIFMAGVFDAFDGRIARASGQTSEFGVEMDSLADVISFGIAPSILVYEYHLKNVGGHPALGLMLGFLPLLFAAFRLARFNVMTMQEGHKSYYLGLPAPAAANILAGLVILHGHTNWAPLFRVILIMTPLVSLAMGSQLHYEGFPRFSIKGSAGNRIKLGVLFISLASVFIFPEFTLCIFMLVYFVSGPTRFLFQLFFGAGDSAEASVFEEDITFDPPVKDPVL